MEVEGERPRPPGYDFDHKIFSSDWILFYSEILTTWNFPILTILKVREWPDWSSWESQKSTKWRIRVKLENFFVNFLNSQSIVNLWCIFSWFLMSFMSFLFWQSLRVIGCVFAKLPKIDHNVANLALTG